MVVASPRPQKILNSEVISDLSQRGVIVITGGGGGIPVIADSEGHIAGVEAVVDKDLTSVLLAQEMGIDQIMILTSIHHVAINFGPVLSGNSKSHKLMSKLSSFNISSASAPLFAWDNLNGQSLKKVLMII